MKIQTISLTGTLVIAASDNIVQWSVVAGTSDAEYTIMGSDSIIGGNTPIAFVEGTGGYNSAQASANNPWDGVTITVTLGTVSVILTRDGSTS